MKIIREVFGSKIEIDLTREEMKEAFRQIQHEADLEDADVVLGQLRKNNDEEYVEKIANAYRTIQDDMTMDEGFFRDAMFKAIAENPYPEKKRYTVRTSTIYYADIEVVARDRAEAERLAIEKEKDACYYPNEDSMMVDDIYEEG